jgi:CRP-like cAMP-binding protein
MSLQPPPPSSAEDSRQTITIALAETEAQRAAVFRFRYDIYVREMGKLRMDDADHTRGLLHDALDDYAKLYAAYDENGAVIGTLRVISGADHIPQPFAQVPHFERFSTLDPAALSFTSRLMVAPGLRGGQAMTALVFRAYADGLQSAAQFDFCICSPGLVDLYEHLGYRRFSGNLVDPVVGYQVVQVLALRDRDHLRAIQSPLLRVLRYAAPATETLAQDGRVLAQWLAKEVPVRSVVRDWVEQEDTFWRFLAEKVRSAVSGTASILEDLDEDEQRRLLRGGTVIDCAVGDRIITTGTVGSEVFVVLGGLVEVRLPGQSSPVAVLDTGQVFGEIAFITDITRTADVVALTEARVLVLSKATLKRMMATAPALAAKVMFNLSRVLCERLVTSNRRLAE